jgi:membrane-associated phospholipid phosphatase
MRTRPSPRWTRTQRFPAPRCPLTAETHRATGLVAAVGLLGLSAVLVSDQGFVRGEVSVFEEVNGWSRWVGAPLEAVMQLGTLAAGMVLIVAVGAATLPRRPRPVVAIAAATVAAWQLDDVLKELIERPRPERLLPDGAIVRDEADGFGFPSGHTTMAFALAAVLHPLLPSRVRWIPWALAVSVGVARVHVGVHWPMDVVGGAALGIAIGSAAGVLMTSRYGRRPA